MTVFTARQLNRALLARQMLLERSTCDRSRGCWSGWAVSRRSTPRRSTSGLWSRMANLERRQVTAALEDGRSCKARCSDPRSMWFRPATTGRSWSPPRRPAGSGSSGVPGALHARPTSWQRPRPSERCFRRVPSPGPFSSEAVGRDLWSWVGMYLDMVRVPPSGTWERRRADLYGLAEEWIPPTADQPGRAASSCWSGDIWALSARPPRPTSAPGPGCRVDRIIPVLERMDLRRYRVRRRQGPARPETEAPCPIPDVPAPVRFLPVWDAILLVHARRKAVIAEEHRPDHLQHQDSPVDADLHGRRGRGGNLALRRRTGVQAGPHSTDPEEVETGAWKTRPKRWRRSIA